MSLDLISLMSKWMSKMQKGGDDIKTKEVIQ
jgi:hypothetical protein